MFREDNMSNYGVDCNVWLSLFSRKEKKKERKKEGALEQVR